MSLLQSAPAFLTDIVGDLAPNWTGQDLHDALIKANLTTVQMQQLAEYLNVESEGNPVDVLSALLMAMLPRGDIIAYLNTSKCLNPTFTVTDWLGYNLAPAFLVILIFAFLQQRKSLFPRFWNGRPGIAYPVNLVDAYEFRTAFVCAFCACIVSILELFDGVWYINPDISHIPSMVQGTVSFTIFLINVLEICFIYYPLFVCLTTSYVFLGHILGFCYTCSWLFLYSYNMYECPIFSSDDVSNINALTTLPIYACLCYLLLRFFVGILRCSYKLCKCKNATATLYIAPPKDFRKTHYCARVKHLFTPPVTIQKQNCLAKFKALCYQTTPGFKYSRRFTITLAVSALALYEAAILYMFSLDKVLTALTVLFANDGPLRKGFEITNQTKTFDTIHSALYAAEDTFWITCYVSLGIIVSFMVQMIFVYKANTLRLWKGDRSFCPSEELSFATLVVANLRYSGYQIAYCIWGFLLIQLVLWVIVFLFTSVIVQPFVAGNSNYFTGFLQNYWLTFVVGYAFYYLQVLVSKLFFLQKKGEILSLDNRRLFHVTTFILFFLNVSIGLVSCLMRIIKALIFGLLYIGRMDRCILMRGWELWDTGYRSYLGFLLLEVTHTHPVLISFCHILQENRKSSHGNERYILKNEDDTELTTTGPNRVARNRWFVAVMLQRNPSIRKYRSPRPKDDAIEKTDMKLEKKSSDAEQEHTDIQAENTGIQSENTNSGSNPPSNPNSTSVGSIVRIAGDALLESHLANVV